MFIPFNQTITKGKPRFVVQALTEGLDTTPVEQRTLETSLRAALAKARVNNTGGEPFNAAYWMSEQVDDTVAAIMDLSFQGLRNPALSGQMFDVFDHLSRAYDILAYPQLPQWKQEIVREALERHALLVKVDRRVEGSEYEGCHPDRVELPHEAKPLLKLVTDIAGVPYDGEQSIFYFSTVLDQLSPFPLSEDPQVSPRRLREE